jgi:gliding motility-associated-like protein
VNAGPTCTYTLTDFTGSITVTDNCTVPASVVITQSPAAGTVLAVSTTTITLTATDANGNASSCTFDVTVADNTVPTFVTCPANQNLSITANCDVALPDYTSTSSVSDNCSPAGSITITQSPVAGTILSGNGTIQTVTLTATDLIGNTATCTFDITVVDAVNPTFVSCTPNQNETPDVNCQFVLPDYTSLSTVSDNCSVAGTITVTQSPAVGATINGTSTITLTATDQAGNASTCTFQVILTDGTPPVITSGCPANQNVSADASCGFTLTDFTGSVTVTDNCNLSASIVITQSPVAGTVLPIGPTTVTLTATDANGNASTCTFDVTVDDNSTPTFVVCPSNQNLTITANCDATLPDYTGTSTVTDNCTAAGSITITQSPVAGTVISGNGTVQTVTLTATDGNGNSVNCAFDVTLVDGVAPTIVTCAPNQNEIPDANCQFTLTDYTSLITTSDNCVTSIITVTQSPVVGTVITGTTTITLTATDQDGNSASCTFDVILLDSTPPTITSGCPANQNGNADASCGFALPDFTSAITVTDNCGTSASVTITQSPVAGTVLALGINTVTITATDQAGNASTCSFDVTVVDVTPPTISCPANITSCDPIVTFVAPIGTDNCSGSITAQTDATGLSSGSTFPMGTTTLTYTVTDGAGNNVSCSFDVTVVDVSVSPTASGDVAYCDTDVMTALTGTASSGGNLTWFSDPLLTVNLGTGTSFTPFNIVGTTTYYLSEDLSGCNSNPDSVNVTVSVCDTLELTIPTGFTPDGDGTNDVWELENINAMYPLNNVQVYGRWGGLLFESQGYAIPWDGTYKGKEMPMGSYYFVIDLGDGSDPIKGTVTIIK